MQVMVTVAGVNRDGNREVSLVTLAFHASVSAASIQDVVRGQKLMMEEVAIASGLKDIETEHRTKR